MLTFRCSFTSRIEALRDDSNRGDGHEYRRWSLDLRDHHQLHHVLPGRRGVLTIIELCRGCLVFGASGWSVCTEYCMGFVCHLDVMQASFFMLWTLLRCFDIHVASDQSGCAIQTKPHDDCIAVPMCVISIFRFANTSFSFAKSSLRIR